MEVYLLQENIDIALNKGKLQTKEEDELLLSFNSLNNNFGVIAINHKRTTSSILSRTKKLIYDMYLKNMSIDEIVKLLKMDYAYINETIEHKKVYTKNKVTKTKSKPINEYELNNIKKDIDDLKQSIKDLTQLVKGLYIYNKVKYLYLSLYVYNLYCKILLVFTNIYLIITAEGVAIFII